MKAYIITLGGVLRGYTTNKYIMQQITRPDIDKFRRNFVDIYHYEIDDDLETYLKDYYFAEESDLYPLLEYYNLKMYHCHDNDNVCTITCIHEIYDFITETGCLDIVANKLVKAIHDLSIIGKYVTDKNFTKMIHYIMMSYTYSILRWQYLGYTSKLDKVRLLINLGYLYKL